MTEHSGPELERLLEAEVLEKYDLPAGPTMWHAHDKVGLDDYVHYFSRNNELYALSWSDFSNTTFIHEENLPPVLVKGGENEHLQIESGPVAGWYSLYEDYENVHI